MDKEDLKNLLQQYLTIETKVSVETINPYEQLKIVKTTSIIKFNGSEIDSSDDYFYVSDIVR